MTSIEPYQDSRLPERFVRWLNSLRRALKPIPDFIYGDGSPEGVVTAGLGARYYNRIGTGGTRLYVKTTASGDTGWDAYG